MRYALMALLLLPLVASAQDMPLFTFTKSGEGWVKAEGKKPDSRFAEGEAEWLKGGLTKSSIPVGGQKFALEYFHRVPSDPRPGEVPDLSQLPRPQGERLLSAVVTADKGTVYAGFLTESAVWAYTPDKDNKLTNGAPYAPLRVRKAYDNSPEARRDAKAKPPTLAVHELTLDTAGRLYAATSQDLQVFDPTGRLSGVLTLPAKGKVEAMAWEGKEKDTLAMWIDGKKWTRAMKP